MSESLTLLAGALLKAAGILVAVNEIRGLILAAPVLYAMYETGGTAMAIWIGLCSLGGIALSVIVPLVMLRRLEAYRTAN